MRGAGRASGNGPDFLLSVLSCALVHIFPHAYQLLFKAAFFLSGQLIFIPYWRMRGTRMALSETACRAEVVDHSALAVPFKEFPATLGIRSQTMTLKIRRTPEAWEYFSIHSRRKMIFSKKHRPKAWSRKMLFMR